MSEFSQRTGVSLRLLDDAFGELEKRLSVHRDEMNLHLVGKKLRTPLLLIHDHEDYRTSIDHSRALEQSWPGARLVETYGLGHRRILRDYHVIQQAVAFVSQAKLSRKSDLEGQLNSPLC
ncbi:MAG: hypothetical protein MK135_06565 [Polyangiaceae bacterium]|nr:hypothetical protein [Polyangiaceae bacterium]